MNVKHYVRALLCLYFSLFISIQSVQAQSLKVGDSLPPELWSMPLQVINHPQGKETLTLSEYRDKLIILDFWATWCSPCIAMLPKQDSLQKQFKDQIQILPVTYQTGEEVSNFMQKYEKRKGVKNSLPKVVGDKVLRTAFSHTYLPHYVWIDADGRVKAITGLEEVKVDKIAAFLTTTEKSLRQKTDPKPVVHDKNAPLFINGNGGDGSRLFYHSLLSGYSPGLSGSYTLSQVDSTKGIRLTGTNLSRLSLFKSAFGERHWVISNNRVIMDVSKPDCLTTKLSGEPYLEWMANGNGFCYELIVPPSHTEQVFEMMRRDLDVLFSDYSAKVEKHKKMCFVLVKVCDKATLMSKGGKPVLINDQYQYRCTNQPLSLLVRNLNMKFLQHSVYPVINETGIDNFVDMDLEADMSDIDSLNKALQKYGLKLVKAEREIDMLVIRDRPVLISN